MVFGFVGLGMWGLRTSGCPAVGPLRDFWGLGFRDLRFLRFRV